jgi:hypothetical protein
MPGGRERTETEWRALFAKTDFEIARIVPVQPGKSVIEARLKNRFFGCGEVGGAVIQEGVRLLSVTASAGCRRCPTSRTFPPMLLSK